tara:strand:+ start:1280 stop:2284 length:1005 start_codon:yes stop_codon:yes gene_type:complete
MDFQNEKALVLDLYKALEKSNFSKRSDEICKFFDHNLIWRGFHPFNLIRGAKEVWDQFWLPLFESLTHVQRRMDIFLAGYNEIQGYEGVWVASMGHLMGLFDHSWLGIPPTQKLIMLRYCEFNKVSGGKITETAMFFDIPHFMAQAGLKPFKSQTAAQLVQPGPITHDGLMFDRQDEEEGLKTKMAIEFMIKDLKTWKNFDLASLELELRRSWNEDMIWWGPTGIGSTYTIERYAKQHSEPFRTGFKERTFNGHVCRVAEGQFGGFFGWPNLSLTPSGFMDMPESDISGDMRVIDMYRRQGTKLSENWIFIDLLHFWKMQGIDVLSETLSELKN